MTKKTHAAPSHLQGHALLQNPRLNRGTAFTLEERRQHGLDGLVPHAVETLDRQAERVNGHLAHKESDLERYIYLTGLLDRNETLFYRVVMADPKRFLPILYSPTVGEACQKFGHLYRRPQGLYISRDMKGRMVEILRNWPEKDVRFICITTGGRILGLGDLGANGMGIAIGKLQMYTACAGVPPEATLPVMFDIGTTQAALRADPLYLGTRQTPPTDRELDALMDEFVTAVQAVFPKCCIHFEDWKGTDAQRMLARYRSEVLCYNDDIQGTASVALAGLMTALATINASLPKQRVLFFGAGSAAIGIADLLVQAMQAEGLSKREAEKRISLFDIEGLVTSDRPDLSKAARPYARDQDAVQDLTKVIDTVKPTILIGVSTQGGAFDRRVIEAMSACNERPIIFALSNPTEKSECTAEQAYTWSKGKALFAAGVQFDDVVIDGKTFHPGQANNFYIFPAIGLATYAAMPTRITDACFIAAAKASADQVSDALRASGMLFPSQSNILEMEVGTATRVAEYMFDAGLATAKRPAEIRPWIESMLYKAEYRDEIA